MSCGCCYYYEDDEEYYQRTEQIRKEQLEKEQVPEIKEIQKVCGFFLDKSVKMSEQG